MPRPRRRITPLELLETRRMPAAITVAPVQVIEANAAAQATFTATLDAATTEPVTLTYSTVNGTARAGRDYTKTQSTVTIPAGSTSATFTVPITATAEAGKANEKFSLSLSTTSGNTLTSKRVAATIVDGNAAPTVLPTDLTVVEPTSGSKRASVTVSLSNPSAKSVRISYTTIDGSAISAGSAREFQARSGYVTIRPGATSVKVPVTIYSRATADETFNLTVSSATNATLSTVRPGGIYSRVVIQDSASSVTRPTIAVSNATAVEGNLETFTVTLSAASTSPVSFRYSTPGSLASALGYGAVSNVLTIPAGETTATITVPTTPSTLYTGSRQFFLGLSAPANAVLAAPIAIGTITSATTGTGTGTGTTTEPTIAVANVAATATPGTASTVNFVVTLSAASTTPVTVDYATTDGTATAGTDYTATTGVLTFAAGVTSLTVPVTLLAETTLPTTETFGLTLSSPTNATLASSTATATITSSATTGGSNPTTTQPSVVVSAGAVSVGTSGTATLPFTVTLTQASTSTVTVVYATADGSAIAGTDYTAASGTLTFAPGVTSQVVDVTVTGETTTSSTKTLSLTIADATNAIITSNSTAGVITYSSGTPNLSVSSPSTAVGTTGTASLTFTVSLSAASTTPVTVAYTTTDGTAVAGTDYTATSGTLTFAAGVTTQTVTVPVVGETTTSSSKTLTLTLSDPTNATDTTPTGTGTINYVVFGQPNVVSNNLTDTSAGAETSTGTTYNAASFTTSSANYTLNSVSLLLAADAATSTASVEIFSNDIGTPGVLVGTLTSPTTYSTTATATAFTSASGITLAANTTYWVVLVANTGSFNWSYTTSETGAGAGFTDSWAQTIDTGTNVGAQWFSYNSSPVQMSVTATPTALS